MNRGAKPGLSEFGKGGKPGKWGKALEKHLWGETERLFLRRLFGRFCVFSGGWHHQEVR